MSNKQRWIIGLSAVLLCGSAVQAASVKLKFERVSPRAITKVSFYGSPFHDKAVFIGRYRSQIKDPVGTEAESIFDELGAGYDDTLSLGSWCMDIYQHENSSWSEYDVIDPALAPDAAPMGAAKAADLNRLFTGFIDTVDTNSTDVDHAAAFQAAVWEIVNEDENYGYDVTTGDFSLSGYNTNNWAGQANTWLANLGSDDADGGLKVFSSADNQDFVYYIPPTSSEEVVPEPMTMLAAGTAVMGLGGYLRRRRRESA